MTKIEQLNIMRELFDKEVEFFKYINVKNPSQSLFEYKKNNKVNPAYTKVLQLYQNNLKLKKFLDI